MPLDPALEVMLKALVDSGSPSLAAGTVEQARQGFDFMTVGLRDPASLARVAGTEDVMVEGAAGPIAARIYRPEGTRGSVPTIVFFHGGGFVIGSIETHDDHARLLCARVGAVVVSVEYRMAPEVQAPVPVADCWAAFQWAVAHVDTLGGDAGALAVAGDSAGGNLAALVAISARDAGVPLAAQLLLYPAVDFDPDGGYASRSDNATGYFLTSEDMLWFGGHYLAEGADPKDPALSPIHAELTGVAPAIVATAEFDPLRDEGEAYAAALEKAGVPVVQRRYDGLIHGFFGLGPLAPTAADAVEELCVDLRRMLGVADD